jgi:hypothetical protein
VGTLSSSEEQLDDDTEEVRSWNRLLAAECLHVDRDAQVATTREHRAPKPTPTQTMPQTIDPLPAANPSAARDAAFAAEICQPATLAWPSPCPPLPLMICVACGEAFTGATEHGDT